MDIGLQLPEVTLRKSGSEGRSGACRSHVDAVQLLRGGGKRVGWPTKSLLVDLLGIDREARARLGRKRRRRASRASADRVLECTIDRDAIGGEQSVQPRTWQ